jgi:hypothetical protein
LNFLFVENILSFFSEQSLSSSSNKNLLKSDKFPTEIYNEANLNNQNPSKGNNCFIKIKFESQNTNKLDRNFNCNKNLVSNEVISIPKNIKLHDNNQNEKENKITNLNEYINLPPIIDENQLSRRNSKQQDILILNSNLNLNTVLKMRRNSYIGSRRSSNANLNLSESSQFKNFIPSTFLLANKLNIPALLGAKLNDSLIEANDSAQETIKDTSFFEEISILYSNENQLINDKYAQVVSELNRISDISFNVFNLSAAADNQELFFIMNHLFNLYKFDESLKINKNTFRNYFSAVNRAYRKNPYHNSIHGCDVTQTIYFLIKTCNVDSICNLSDLDLFSVFFASAIHDVGHPGNNNNWEIAIKSSLALSYNDKAVLENYHLCKAFCLAKTQDCNIFSSFSLKDYNASRALIISMVLITDIANHFSDLATLKAKNKSAEISPAGADKQFLLNQLVHACDISNPMKPVEIYREWVERIFMEFFSQGDKERENGLKVSFLCDRNTTNIIDAQVGFIDGIVFPLYDALSVPFPNVKMIGNLIQNNKEELKKMKESGYNFLV